MCIRWKGFGGCGCSHGAGEDEFKKMRTDPNVLDIFFRQIRSDLGISRCLCECPWCANIASLWSVVLLVIFWWNILGLEAALECSATRAVWMSSDSLSNQVLSINCFFEKTKLSPLMPMRLGMDQDAMVQRLNHMQERQVIHVVSPVQFFAFVQTWNVNIGYLLCAIRPSSLLKVSHVYILKNCTMVHSCEPFHACIMTIYDYYVCTVGLLAVRGSVWSLKSKLDFVDFWQFLLSGCIWLFLAVLLRSPVSSCEGDHLPQSKAGGRRWRTWEWRPTQARRGRR